MIHCTKFGADPSMGSCGKMDLFFNYHSLLYIVFFLQTA